MKKKVYLHVGFHKTGTTAIQETFYRYSNELKDLGINYATKSRRANQSHKQMLIDCCDGEVARWRNTKSPTGIFLDKLGHYGAESLIPICFGLRLANWPNQPITSSIYPYLGALLAVLIIINKALNDAVHVARAFSGLPKLEDAKGVNLPRKGLLRLARKVFNFLPAHRIFHSVEFTMYVAIFGSFAISLQIALIIALFVTVGHILAIITSAKLRNN
jgi:phosphatidylglycerophosphate synthase